MFVELRRNWQLARIGELQKVPKVSSPDEKYMMDNSDFLCFSTLLSSRKSEVNGSNGELFGRSVGLSRTEQNWAGWQLSNEFCTTTLPAQGCQQQRQLELVGCEISWVLAMEIPR